MTEEQFRECCLEFCRKFPHLPRLKTIAVVGGYDAEIGGVGVDSRRLTDVLTYLLRSGVPLDPAFEIDLINFREGRDFLFEKTQADLIFVSNIISGRFNCLPVFWAANAGKISNLELITTVSRRNVPDCWAHRLDVAGAKLVATFGGKVEINAQIFGDTYGLGFTVLIPSPEQECCSRYTSSCDLKHLYPTLKNIDLPQGWLGFAADKEFLKSISSSLDRSTCLGQRALDYSTQQKHSDIGADIGAGNHQWGHLLPSRYPSR